MKKVFALLCIVGVVYPYYYIFKFIETNNWQWSTSLFFEQINQNYAMNILNADLTIAATSFLIFLIYRLRVKAIKKNQFIKYLASLFIVGFSLALPITDYNCVDMLITELAVFKFIDSQLTLIEILPGSSLEEVRLKTEAKFIEKLN